MISPESIQEVRARANIVEVIGETVELRRTGSSVTGLCPFHSERSPSFNVRADSGFYHCFGCGASGNVISFVMETRGLSFPEAIEYLAGRYGVELKRTGGKSFQKEKSPDLRKMFDLNSLALEYYHKALQNAPKQVVDYINGRKLTAEALHEFKVGFASRERRGLYDVLRSKGATDELLLRSGLVRRTPEGELYDTFRGRLLFPIYADTKKIAGFGGRVIPSLFEKEQLDRVPKYLNSPETPVYQKNKILFGMPQAVRGMREQGRAYIVEGYLDVVGLWRVNVKNSMATCGTALTEEHVRRLGRLTKRVTLLFDGDAAGRSAAGRAFVTCLNAEIDIDAIFLPEEHDPDTLAAQYGATTAEYLDSCEKQDLLSCFLDTLVRQSGYEKISDLGPAAVDKVAQEVSKAIAKVRRPIVRERLVEQASFRLRIKSEMLMADQVVSAGGVAEVVVPKLSRETEPTLSRIEELPRLDQEVLICVMALKSEIPLRILHDAVLCDVLHPVTLRFVDELHTLVTRFGENEERLKDAVKGLLKEGGETWVKHWKQAHSIIRDPDVNIRKNFEECLTRVRRGRLEATLSELDERIRSTRDEHEQVLLHQERLRLVRQIKEGPPRVAVNG